jgi:hypothetical protein
VRVFQKVRHQKEKKEKLRDVVDKPQKKYELMAEVIYQRDKGKTSLIENLLQRIASPFIDQVVVLRLPEMFKVPDIATFTGLEDLIEHLENFRSHSNLHGTLEEITCQAFPLTLSGNAQDWFRKLPSKSINDFKALRKTFLVQFMARWMRKKLSGYLMTLTQGLDESLKNYLMRFNHEKLTV